MGLNKRDLRKLLREGVDVGGVVLGIIVAALVAAFPPSSLAEWFFLLAGLSILAAVWLWGRRWVSVPPVSYFEPIYFGDTARRATGSVLQISTPLVAHAAQGLANFEKARPEFVHAAPRNEEVDEVIGKLKQGEVAILYGGPGEGKSMTAYLAAYDLSSNDKRSPYLLRVDRLKAKSGHGLAPDLVEQLDLLKGSRKLVIVDESQKLPEERREELMTLMRNEAGADAVDVIWLETEFYEQVAGPPPIGHIRVKFGPFLERLINGLYKSPEVEIRHALRGRIDGLEEAIKMAKAGQIRDPWHLAFVASGGEARVEREIAALNVAETLVIFLISAHAVVSGGDELTVVGLEGLVERVRKLGIGWVEDELPAGCVKGVVQGLQEYVHAPSTYRDTSDRMSLIRVYDRSENDRGYIASLHYNFARAIVIAALRKKQEIAEDLVKILASVLTSDYDQCGFVSYLLGCLGKDRVPGFVRDNEQWFSGFVRTTSGDRIAECANVLSLLRQCDSGEHRRLVEQLDIPRLASAVSNSEVSEFSKVGALLQSMGGGRDALLSVVREEGWKSLADKMIAAKSNQLGGLAYLLISLYGKQDEVLECVGKIPGGWKTLAVELGSAKSEDIGRVAAFLGSLGKAEGRTDWRATLLQELTDEAWRQLAKQVSVTEVSGFLALAYFVKSLGNRRGELMMRIDKIEGAWESLTAKVGKAKAADFDGVGKLLDALNDKRDALLDKLTEDEWGALASEAAQAKMGDFGGLAILLNALPDKRDALLGKLTEDEWGTLATQAAQAKAGDFGGLAKLLNALPDKRDALLDRLTEDEWGDLASQLAQAKLSDFSHVAELLDALPDKRGALLGKIKDEEWKALAGQVAQAKLSDFSHVTELLDALPDKRGALLGKIKDEEWKALAGQVTQAKVSDLPQVAALVRVLGVRDIAIEESTDRQADEASAEREPAAGQVAPSLLDRRGLLLQYVNVSWLAKTANACSGEELGDLTKLVAALDDERRSELQRAVDWPALVTKCPLRAETLFALGACLENLWKPVEQEGSEPSGLERAAFYLKEHRHQLEDAVRAAYKAEWRRYGGAAKFLFNCHHVNGPMAFQIAEGTFEDAARSFLVVPTNHRYVGQLINAFHEVSPDLAARCLSDHIVFGRIVRSLDTHDWGGRVRDTRHMVKAIIRVSPRIWGEMSKKIKADLKTLDVQSIRAELDQEAAA
jgi:hypothetical protein